MSEIPSTGQLSYKSRNHYKTANVPYQKTIHDPYQHVHVSENEIKDIDYTFAPEKDESSAEDVKPLNFYNDNSLEFEEVYPPQVKIRDDEVLKTPANFHQVF